MKKFLSGLCAVSLLALSAMSYAGDVPVTTVYDSFKEGYIAVFSGPGSISQTRISNDELTQALKNIEQQKSDSEASSRKTDDLTNKISQLERDNSDLKSSIDQLKRSLDDMKRDNDRLASQVSDLASKVK